ncbi:ABC transporter ATP-binding protein [Papillibacter cinnamivorans]|uniref:Putative ABC transport system ATP-binding protein n=1 Tax=Papillibacter cinnamivorans DSM 12816 TaxID=1122930 RepID=A0A1W2C6N2_9FIRM|nr:ABC transporter ATP-binding protein [Papillibacter cinnamivorans]SMC80766.1 putative ABC transport system ATP-binding protein [Papillibacter cinnamivorans DSM 12816]
MTDKIMIELTDAYKIYSSAENEVRAIDGINLKVREGEYISIVGPSGSGKSTCMNIIGCLDVLTSGTYILNGKDVSDMSRDELATIRNRTLGFIFQQYNLISKLNVYENVELPLLYSGMKKEQRDERIKSVLEKVGLTDRAKHYPAQLSGGQQQRVSIARALAGNPPLILADEPTGALDSKTGREIMAAIKILNREGTTIVVITHDMSIAQEAPRIVRFYDGKIISDETSKEVSAQ